MKIVQLLPLQVYILTSNCYSNQDVSMCLLRNVWKVLINVFVGKNKYFLIS